MTFSTSNSTSGFHMFDQNDISETQFLKDAIVNHTKYGSTNHNSSVSQNYRYITHYVDANDTLQGLALKYGCKIETLKKFNKIYSDDNNYLRSRLSLLIPIEISIEGSSSNIDSDLSSAQTSSSSLDGRYPSAISNSSFAAKISSHHSMNFENQNSKNNSAKHLAKSPNKSKSLCDSSQVENNRDTNTSATHESVADFLIRIDSSIAKTKNQVEKMAQKNDMNAIEEELYRNSTKRFSTPKLTTSDQSAISAASSSRHSIFPFDSDGTTSRVVTSNNNKRKVKSSLKRHAKNQEEIFEL